MRWKQINERIAKERKMGVGGKHGRLRIFEREWVVDERNPNETFLVGIPPATPLDRAIHGASTICARFWRACMARMFATKFRASRIIQRAARIYLAKTLAKRIKKRREDNEKRVKEMFRRRYSMAFNKWYETAHKQRQTRRFGAILNGAFSENWIRACFDSLRENRDKEKRAALNVIKHFRHWTFVRFRKRVFNDWYNWYAQNSNIRGFVRERCFRRWKHNVKTAVLIRKNAAEYRGAVGFQRLWRGVMGRRQYLMAQFKAESDMEAFFQMRENMATKINCRVRICLSHNRFDSRRCAKHVMTLVLLKVLKRVQMIENVKHVSNLRKAEALRLADEEDHVMCRVREALDRAATLKAEEFERQHFLKKYVVFGKRAKYLTAAEKAGVIEATTTFARTTFRARWPPPMECVKCFRTFVVRTAMENHVCQVPEPTDNSNQ